MLDWTMRPPAFSILADEMSAELHSDEHRDLLTVGFTLGEPAVDARLVLVANSYQPVVEGPARLGNLPAEGLAVERDGARGVGGSDVEVHDAGHGDLLHPIEAGRSSSAMAAFRNRMASAPVTRDDRR